MSDIQRFSRFCGHQSIKLGVAWELIGKRDKGAAQFQKPMANIHVGDIGELRVGDSQELGKLYAVGRRLIEHDQKFGVCQHGTRRVGLAKVDRLPSTNSPMARASSAAAGSGCRSSSFLKSLGVGGSIVHLLCLLSR